jgi:hypothetical protein
VHEPARHRRPVADLLGDRARRADERRRLDEDLAQRAAAILHAVAEVVEDRPQAHARAGAERVQDVGDVHRRLRLRGRDRLVGGQHAGRRRAAVGDVEEHVLQRRVRAQLRAHVAVQRAELLLDRHGDHGLALDGLELGDGAGGHAAEADLVDAGHDARRVLELEARLVGGRQRALADIGDDVAEDRQRHRQEDGDRRRGRRPAPDLQAQARAIEALVDARPSVDHGLPLRPVLRRLAGSVPGVGPSGE